MKIYILVSFITLILGLIITLAQINSDKFPIVEEKTMGQAIVACIIRIALIVWGANLLFL